MRSLIVIFFFFFLFIAIDIWSVGVILLSVLTGRYPFFVAQDEGDSLLEFASLFGLKDMKECAAIYSKFFYYYFYLIIIII